MKKPALAITAGVVFVGVLVFRLIERGSAPAEPAPPVIEQVAMPAPVPAAAEERPAHQSVTSQERVQAPPPPTDQQPPGDQKFLSGGSQPGKPPAGWWGNGAGYDTEVDRDVSRSGKGSLRISSIANDPEGRANAGQLIKADAYRGRRVQLTASIKTENVSNGAGLWLRVEGTDGGVLAFANMQTPQLKLAGTRYWTDARLVLDIPESAGALAYGLILAGRGRAWMDDLRISVVDELTPVTRLPFSKATVFFPTRKDDLPSSPINPDFEQ